MTTVRSIRVQGPLLPPEALLDRVLFDVAGWLGQAVAVNADRLRVGLLTPSIVARAAHDGWALAGEEPPPSLLARYEEQVRGAIWLREQAVQTQLGRLREGLGLRQPAQEFTLTEWQHEARYSTLEIPDVFPFYYRGPGFRVPPRRPSLRDRARALHEQIREACQEPYELGFSLGRALRQRFHVGALLDYVPGELGRDEYGQEWDLDEET